MNPRAPVASGIAKVLVLVGVLPLMAGFGYALFEGLAGPTMGVNLGAVFLLLAGAAPIAAGIALDRWACRQSDARPAGFDVITHPRAESPRPARTEPSRDAQDDPTSSPSQ
jgi:hypothetical protein